MLWITEVEKAAKWVKGTISTAGMISRDGQGHFLIISRGDQDKTKGYGIPFSRFSLQFQG